MLTILTATCDRPEAFALTERWIARQSTKPDQWLVLDDGTVPAKCTQGQEHHHWPEFRGHGSMVNKVKRALESGLIKGDFLTFIEDDDWVSPDYLAWSLSQLAKYDLVGECSNLYYNVRHRWWFCHENRFHASLCATSMRRSVFPQLLAECNFSLDPFIDSRLWENCRLPKFATAPAQGSRRRTVGIKAMPGTPGYGSGHDRTSGWAQQDPEGKVLRNLIGSDADLYAPYYESPRKTRDIKQSDGMPTVEIHIVTFNEELILPYTLRHYRTFASKIIVHDGGSTDRTVEIAKATGAVVIPWDTAGKINDTLLRQLKENCWKNTTADWVGVVDADEFLYFPCGAEAALNAYEKVALAVVKPHGYEMVSETLPTGDGQIYDEIKMGADDNRWYAKPCFFSAKRVSEIHFSAGAHECSVVVNGTLRMGNPTRFSEPAAHLLHYHHIGSVERIGAKYDGNKARFSEENKKHGWGWHGDGLKHAQDKRNAIMAKIKKVVA